MHKHKKLEIYKKRCKHIYNNMINIHQNIPNNLLLLFSLLYNYPESLENQLYVATETVILHIL